MAKEWRDWKKIAEGQEANVAGLSALVDEYRQALQKRDAWWRERIERHVYGLLDSQDVSVGHVRLLLAEVCEHGYTPSHCARDALRVEQPRPCATCGGTREVRCDGCASGMRYDPDCDGRMPCPDCLVAEPEREGAS